MIKVTRRRFIARRLDACRRILRLNTRRIRIELVNRLREIFDSAHRMAQDQKLEFKERGKWARVAAYAAQTIDGICSKFDEQQIDKSLAELERLVNEARAKAQARKLQAGATVDRRNPDPPRPS